MDPIFIGRYRVLEEVGRGGMGIVYKAEDPSLERLVAIKILPPKLLRNKDALRRFLREAKVAAKLDHPNIVPIYDIGDDGGTYFMVMEYLEGQTMREWIEGRTEINLEKSLHLFIQIAKALDYAHKRKVIHRDVKPENIMVLADDRAKVMDFGIAVMDDRHSVTQMGAVLGTIAYISPEQAEGNQADARSDIYSLGIILFECLTGHLPFQARTASEMLSHHLSTVPPPPSAFNKEVPKKLDQIVLKTLAKNPDERFQSVADLLEALKETRDQPKTAGDFLSSPSKTEGFQSGGQLFFPAQPVTPSAGFDKTEILEGLKNLLKSVEKKPSEKPEPALPSDSFVKYRPIVDRIQKDLEALQDDIPSSTDDQSDLQVQEQLREKIQVPCVKCGASNDPLQKYCLECGSLLASATISTHPDAMNQAISLYQAGHYDEALRMSQEVLKRDARIAEAHYYAALCLMKGNRLVEALASFRKAVELQPDNAAAWEGLGDAEFSLSHDNEAREAYQSAVRAAPSATVYSKLARPLENLGRLEDACKALYKAVELEPENLEPAYDLIRILIGLSRFDEALFRVRKILDQNPQDVEALRLIGEIYEQTDRYGLALQSYERALSLRPDDARSRYKIGSLLEQRNLPGEAITHLTKAVQSDPSNPDIHAKLGKLYLKENQDDQALLHLETASKLNPNSPEVHKELGKLYMKKSDLDSATVQLEWTIALDPADSDAHGKLGQIYFRKNQTQHSIREYKTAIQLDPYNPEFHENLGMVYYVEEDMEEAVDEMKKAVSLDPDNVDYRKALGVMYETKGKLDLARKEYQKVVEIAPYDALAQGLLGRVYFEQNLINLAIYQYLKSLELDPDSYLMQNLLGKAYLKVGKYDDAISTLQKALQRAPSPDSQRNKQILGKNYYYLGVAALEKGDAAGAVAALQQSIHHLPTFAKAYHLQAKARMALGDKSQAQQLLLQASRLAGSDEGEIFADLAGILNQSGDQGGAIKALGKAIQSAPQQAAYHGFLGDLYFTQGDLESALSSYQQALRWEKSKKDFYHWKCGNVLSARKNFGEAAEQLEAACGLAPDNWKYHQDLAKVYEVLGMTGEAINELEKAKRNATQDSDALSLIQDSIRRLKT